LSSKAFKSSRTDSILKILGVILSLYLFIVGISGLGEAFQMFGEELIEKILSATGNPFTALFIGILATAIVQSSSTSTSIIVGMVAGGVIPLESAVTMIMGANLGTTITGMIVSFGHFRRPYEFRRAFSAASLHMTFKIVAIAILFPLELTTRFLTKLAGNAQSLFSDIGGMAISNPLKLATEPMIAFLKIIAFNNAILLLLLTLLITYAMLVAIVKLLRSLVLTRIEAFFDRVLFLNWRRAMLFGFFLTAAVQSSSISTTLTIPLAAAAILRLGQIYPFNLGANVGTTITATLAALATGQKEPIVAAFAHILFNVLAILLIWGIPPLRRLPLAGAVWLGKIGIRKRAVPILTVVGVYFLIPLLIILLIQ